MPLSDDEQRAIEALESSLARGEVAPEGVYDRSPALSVNETTAHTLGDILVDAIERDQQRIRRTIGSNVIRVLEHVGAAAQRWRIGW